MSEWWNGVVGVLVVLLPFLLVLVGPAIRLVALGTIPRNRKPSTGTAWLLAILLWPSVGLLVFALLGSNKVGRKRQERMAEVNRLIAERTRDVVDTVPDLGGDNDDEIAGLVRMNRALGYLPLTPGNDVDLLPGYADSITAMTDAIRGATDHVHIEFYISAWDDVTGPLLEEMAAAADRGVAVRFLFDHLGSRGIPGYRDFLKKLDATGIQWHPMLPVRPLRGRFRRPDLRNHRKLLVVDGRVGFTGSQNLVEPGYNKPKNHELGREWVELMLRLRGPVVTELAAVFASDWYAETGDLLEVAQPADVPAPDAPPQVTSVDCQLVPSGPGYDGENNLRMFTTLLYSAHRRAVLTSPYFVPDESLLYAVTSAVHRGVDVELYVSELSDQFMVGHAQASYYEALLEAGVTIRMYPPPYILHSKHLTIDEDVAVVGTSNMDLRSFSLNYEMSLLLLGAPFVDALREVEAVYREKSRVLTLEEWHERPFRKKYLDTVMRLTSALQ